MKLSPILAVVVLGGLWGYEYTSHLTPERAQESIDSNVLPLVTVPFSKGIVLITQTDPKTTKTAGYEAWYFEKTRLFGWRLNETSIDTFNPPIASISANGQTFVWGTSGDSKAQAIIYRDNNKIYKSRVGSYGFWNMSLPFTQNTFSESDWAAVLSNGAISPLYK